MPPTTAAILRASRDDGRRISRRMTGLAEDAAPRQAEVDPAAQVALEDDDNIAADQRARALEAFAQIDPARATGGSCGLGLAIVRRIVAACGGEIILAEAQGGGLAVIMNFPLQS